VSRFFAVFLLSCLSLTTQGCTVAAVKAMDEVDRTISKLAQADCELVRLAHGEDVCQSLDMNAEPDPVYCYRRLGGVDCYARREPADRPIVREQGPQPIRTTDRTVY